MRRTAIKRLVFSLLVIGAIACGGVWMVLSSVPAARSPGAKPAARQLLYEQAISQPPKPKSPTSVTGAVTPGATQTGGQAQLPQSEAVTTTGSAPPGAGVEIDVSKPSTEQAVAAPDGTSQPPAAAPDGMPPLPGEGAGPPQDQAALPAAPNANGDGSMPPLPGQGSQGSDQWANRGGQQWGNQGADQWGGQPGNQWGGQAGDQWGGQPGNQLNGQPGNQWGGQGATQWADQNTEEWVEVIISGAAMRATAAEDAPMLFAFPYGRSLKVVSRYEGWVEVTDPKSAATGWMQAHNLAPSGAARQQTYSQNEAYYEEPREQPGFLRRKASGFADMINRALGGF